MKRYFVGQTMVGLLFFVALWVGVVTNAYAGKLTEAFKQASVSTECVSSIAKFEEQITNGFGKLGKPELVFHITKNNANPDKQMAGAMIVVSILGMRTQIMMSVSPNLKSSCDLQYDTITSYTASCGEVYKKYNLTPGKIVSDSNGISVISTSVGYSYYFATDAGCNVVSRTFMYGDK